jgi:hypothetical protein
LALLSLSLYFAMHLVKNSAMNTVCPSPGGLYPAQQSDKLICSFVGLLRRITNSHLSPDDPPLETKTTRHCRAARTGDTCMSAYPLCGCPTSCVLANRLALLICQILLCYVTRILSA